MSPSCWISLPGSVSLKLQSNLLRPLGFVECEFLSLAQICTET